MEQAAVVRQLKIKTGSLKRNTKDYTSYDQERAQIATKVENLKAQGVDESNIKQAEQELAETL
jgi:tubulin-specific chaperone A